MLVGKGRVKRRFVIGNELLEVLIQLAVLRERRSDGRFETRPVQIRDFVDWLAGRYGLLIDRLGPGMAPEERTGQPGPGSELRGPEDPLAPARLLHRPGGCVQLPGHCTPLCHHRRRA